MSGAGAIDRAHVAVYQNFAAAWEFVHATINAGHACARFAEDRDAARVVFAAWMVRGPAPARIDG
ncbi:hypothetical protein DQP58_20420 [Mycobacterium colombiense]|uniref:Uncharacterized protein n=1 Tax=Mycobacterium colombiense TaxID=339268 RepID=A0A329K6I4_9MYCO|nr:hypothetical protein DQP58_20420 [Mycobacterium colombiense]